LAKDRCSAENARKDEFHQLPAMLEAKRRPYSLSDENGKHFRASSLRSPDEDPAKLHLMTSVNTEGYVRVWFSPKQTFHNVSKVCWDQNISDLGGGKWTIVSFLTAAEYLERRTLVIRRPTFPKTAVRALRRVRRKTE
jgi:hypothetical protein